VNREQRRKAAKNQNNSSVLMKQTFNTPNNAVSLAISLHKTGQISQAEEMYEHILKSEPQNAKILNGLGLIKLQTKDEQNALRLISTAVKIEPNNVGYLNNLGNVYRAANRLDDAINCYQNALRLQPDYADSYFNLGIALTEKDLVSEAISTLFQAIAANPRHSRAHFTVGDLLQEQGLLDEAIASYNKGLSIQPNFFEGLTSLGMAFYRKGDLKAAQAVYEHALSIDPYSTAALSNIGAVFYEQGRIKIADACYREVTKLAPNSPDAYINLGFVLSQQGKKEEAVECYKQAIKHDPNSIKAMSSLAEILGKQSQWEEAIKLYHRIIEIDSNADAYTHLGIALGEIGDVSGAIAQFEQTRKINPRHTKAYAHLGLVLQKHEKIEEAKSIFDYSELVAKYQFDSVEGWNSIKDYNAALHKYIYAHPTLLKDRPGKPLNKGRQTHEIFTDNALVITALSEIVNRHLKNYLSNCSINTKNNFFNDFPETWKLSGWAVVLEPEGFQNSHIHPESLISGVYYIQIPDAVKQNNSGEGNLSFADLFINETANDQIDKYTVKPEEGLLVLFPSYFWHSTIPFSGDKDRVCISFNVIPA
jgi:tetratricopeptide (TPR) repeat protein